MVCPELQEVRALGKVVELRRRYWGAVPIPDTTPLTYEDLRRLRRNEVVTLVTHSLGFDGKEMAPKATAHVVKVTKNQPEGYTDLQGFWSCSEIPAASAVDALDMFHDRTPGRMVPPHVLCFKDVATGYSFRLLIGLERFEVYRERKVIN